LARFIIEKEKEIEKMCGLYYQDFVDSVEQLLKVRQGSSTLKDKVSTMSSSIQSVGTKLLEKVGCSKIEGNSGM
jgi:phage shock protein A